MFYNVEGIYVEQNKGGLVMMAAAKILTILIALFLNHLAFATSSNVSHRSYKKIIGDLKNIESQHRELVEYIEYGYSRDNRPLTLLKIKTNNKISSLPDKNKATENVRQAILITGGIHGDEFLGVEIPLLIKLLQNRSNLKGLSNFLNSNGVIYFVPVMNPDGYDARKRENFNGIDLNRDFDDYEKNILKMTQSEVSDFVSFIEKELMLNKLKLSFWLDFHCCDNSLVYPLASGKKLPPEDQVKFDLISQLAKSTISFNKFGNPYNVLGMKADHLGMDYFYLKHGTLAFAYEGHDGGDAANVSGFVKFINDTLIKLIK